MPAQSRQGRRQGGARHGPQACADWLRQAIGRHRAGDLDAADRLYRRVLAVQPGHPDALHFSGVLQHQRGRSGEAVVLIERALTQVPGHADAHNNLGNVHKECGRMPEAEACYRHALACVPAHLDALGNLGLVLEAQDRGEDALEAYSELVRHAPGHARGHYLLGMFLSGYAQHLGHMEQALDCLRTSCRLEPRNGRALEMQGMLLYSMQRHDEAVEVYRDWLRREPDNPIPRHMLAACGGGDAPARADDDYVRELFDGFADSFDEQLLRNLDYRAPQLLADALGRVLAAPSGALSVLDAGCGTGLCAPLLRPWARSLSGVDLSGGMVDKARQHGGYDALVVAELTAYLEEHPGAFDVVASADTLVYFGELDRVAAAAFGALRPGGWLAFTVEALDDDGERHELGPSGRYRHSRGLVGHRLSAAGFIGLRIERRVLRMEVGKPVNGWVVLATRVA